MSAKTSIEHIITKKDLLKDYIDFLLVILLSFFVKYDAKEVALSIWFYSVVITYLLAVVSLFVYSDLIKKNLGLYLRIFISIVVSVLIYHYFFRIQLVFINAGFSAFNGERTLDEMAIFDVDNFAPFVPFVPFVVYKYRDYFIPPSAKDLEKDLSMPSKMFFLCYKTQFLAIISIILGLAYSYNPQVSFYITYTLFFFPFSKTFKFLKQKKGRK